MSGFELLDNVTVLDETDFYFGRTGKVTDRTSENGHTLYCVRFGSASMISWYESNQIALITHHEQVQPATPSPATEATAGEDDPDVVLLSELHDILMDANELPITHGRMKERMAGLRRLASEQLKSSVDLSPVKAYADQGLKINAIKEYRTLIKGATIKAARAWVEDYLHAEQMKREGKPTYEQLEAEAARLRAAIEEISGAGTMVQVGKALDRLAAANALAAGKGE